MRDGNRRSRVKNLQRVLVIRSPLPHGVENGFQRLPEFGERVHDARRHFGEHLAEISPSSSSERRLSDQNLFADSRYGLGKSGKALRLRE